MNDFDNFDKDYYLNFHPLSVSKKYPTILIKIFPQEQNFPILLFFVSILFRIRKKKKKKLLVVDMYMQGLIKLEYFRFQLHFYKPNEE